VFVEAVVQSKATADYTVMALRKLPSQQPHFGPGGAVEDRETVEMLPCALVFIDVQAAGSPNFKSKNPLSYVRQAICLNKSLLHAGFPRLNIFTNAVDAVLSESGDSPPSEHPIVHQLKITMDVPKEALFYAAHFKLDVITQATEMLKLNGMLLLLDTDMVAMRTLDEDLLRRCKAAGVGAFDISDQVFPAYGSKRVTDDLETVADRQLANPRWYGGEFLLASRSFLHRLVPIARQRYEKYVQEIGHLNHQGDEVFISAALNTLADDGQHIVEVGAYQAVGRHWAGNTHRDLRWFRGCCFLHLSGAKKLFENESRFREFNPGRFWRKVVMGHFIGRIQFAVKLFLKR
jgi:hypothetical protein